ncbi:MAG: EVE domain-containing protein, partial [Pseudomonadota bacterium]
MAYWLFKYEPGAWSWDEQNAKAAEGEPWDGVRNHQANNNMKAMAVGDLGFFYHSVNEKQVVGVCEVIREAHPDSTDPTGKWECVDLKAVAPFPNPVTLAAIKA